MNKRARQNVVFEHGLLVGLLGSDRVVAIMKGEVEMPSDLHGLVYKHLADGQQFGSIKLDLFRELKEAGYNLSAEKTI